MSITLKISLAEYDAMIAADAFASLGQRRLELIWGEIRDMNPPGPTHEDLIDALTAWSTQPALRDCLRVRIQNSIGLPRLNSAPQPDVVWAKPRRYGQRRPHAVDVLLVIEVADSSLVYDLGEKASLYAGGGINDYWVVDVVNFAVHVFRDPAGLEFKQHTRWGLGSHVTPLAFPEVSLSVDELFGHAE